jgi:rhodanese-related sulfurtransferase
VALELVQAGFSVKRVYALEGGMQAWLEAGLPMAGGTTPGN